MLMMVLLNKLYRHIPFGWGLADVFGHAIHQLLFIILSIFLFKDTSLIYSETFLMSTLLINLAFTYKVTYGRGGEYRWNGSLFIKKYKSEVKFRVLNAKDLKK